MLCMLGCFRVRPRSRELSQPESCPKASYFSKDSTTLSLWSCRCGPVAVVLSLWSCRCGRLELAHTIVGIVLVARQAWCEQVGELTGFTVLSHGVDSQRDRLDYERVDKFRWWF